MVYKPTGGTLYMEIWDLYGIYGILMELWDGYLLMDYHVEVSIVMRVPP